MLFRDNLQELFAPVVQALIAVGRLFGVGLAGVLHPFAKQLRVFLQDQVLAENGVCLWEKENTCITNEAKQTRTHNLQDGFRMSLHFF